MISPGLMLLFYCILVIAASLAGGWLPIRWKLGHMQMQFMMSFVAGLMLGVAVLHLLPHAAAELPSLDVTCAWALIGLLAMFFVIRVFHVHQHSVADPSLHDGGEHEDDHHGHAHDERHHHAHGHPVRIGSRLGWMGLAFGLSLHSFFDGVALGAQLAADTRLHADMAFPGVGVFFVVLLHKPLDALAITALMTAAGWSLRAMLGVNLAFALVCPAGAVLFFWGAAGHATLVGAALAMAAGVFICIALADILPEVSFHSHDRLALSMALLAGVVMAIVIGVFEGEGHGHGHQHGRGHEHQHGHDHEH